jgi:predicted transcriptional regulator
METTVSPVQVPRELATKLEALAVRLERSHVWIIEQALVGFIDQGDDGWRLPLEALADVDFGRLVAHEVVQAWVESLESAIRCRFAAMKVQWTSSPLRLGAAL